MEKYKVEITREALQDMEDIYNYIATDLLSPEKSMELRRMLVDNYSVFYTIHEDKVIVTNVLYTVSDIEARLCGV